MNNTHITKDANSLPFPAPLAIDVLHTPEAVRAYEKEVARIYEHNRTTARLAKEAQTKAASTESRNMTDSEYFAMAQERQALKLAKEAEAESVRLKAEQDKQDTLNSSPAVVNLTETNAHMLAIALNHWLSVRNYTIDTDDINHFTNGLYALTLLAPATGKKAGK